MDLPLIHLLSGDGLRAEALARAVEPSWRVRRFARAADFLAAAGAEPAPALLLIDVVADTRRGKDLCSRLRRTPPGRDLPVVFLTAEEAPLPVLRALLACGDDFVVWPSGADALQARLELHLGRRQCPAPHAPAPAPPAAEADRAAGTGQAARRSLQRLVDIGLAFGAERDRRTLLRVIIESGRALANCDAATLFLRTERQTLRFELRTQTDPLPVTELPLYDPDTGAPNHRFVATHVALSANAIVIDDVYAETRFDLSGTKHFSATSGLRAVSMVTVPMTLHTGEVVGVLQFVNAREPKTGDLARFDRDLVRTLTAMAAHAAVAVENVQLIEGQKALMESLIRIIAGAIDAKSHYTGGHAERVPELALMLAQAASRVGEGPLASFGFDTEDEWREFRIGAWLHDCGKVTSPEYVIDKATKLETIYNRIHEIRTRFEVLLRDARIEALEAIARGEPEDQARSACDAREASLRKDFAFVAACNLGSEFMPPADVERLKRIAARTWWRHFDDRLGLSEAELQRCAGVPSALPACERLLDDRPEHLVPREAHDHLDDRHGFRLEVPEHLYHRGEIHNLCVSRGTLTEEERFKINEHIVQTIVMLEKLPLPQNLRRVPEYAGTHHETLTGDGYPRRLGASDLSVPARIMAIADIFEALTATDRPYKKTKKLSECVRILWQFKNRGQIDPVLFDLFLQSGVYRAYAQRFLRPEQIDAVDIEPYLGPVGGGG